MMSERRCDQQERGAESLTWRVSWLTFAKTVGFVFSIALPLLLVRRMDREQYGLYKQAFLLVTTAMTVLPLGVAMSAFYFLPREKTRRRETVLNIVLFHVVIGALACGALALYPSILTAIFQRRAAGALFGLDRRRRFCSGSRELFSTWFRWPMTRFGWPRRSSWEFRPRAR